MNNTDNAFRAWVRKVRSAYVGIPSVKTWRVWDGSPADDDQFTASNTPWVRLTPLAGPPSRYDTTGIVTTTDFVLRVQIETVVNGYDWGVTAKLSDNLIKAMFPYADTADRSALDADLIDVGISDVQLTAVPLPRSVDEMSGGLIRAVGEVVLLLNLET